MAKSHTISRRISPSRSFLPVFRDHSETNAVREMAEQPKTARLPRAVVDRALPRPNGGDSLSAHPSSR
jgi:hypothetical protein